MSDAYLSLWLEAPLQSWGHDSKFGRRDSLDFPTKSGVLGLICCALGADGAQREWLAQWADRDMQVIAYVPSKAGKALSRLPMLRDFQMVGSGYDDQDIWQNLLIPKTSDGKKPVGGGTKMTYRYYLQDMAYAVFLQGEQQQLELLTEALCHPVWDLYLGRKNCVPSEFIYQGIFADIDLAINAAESFAHAEHKQRQAVFRVKQGEYEGEVFTLNDVPIQFGQQKQYRDRRVTVLAWDADID